MDNYKIGSEVERLLNLTYGSEKTPEKYLNKAKNLLNNTELIDKLGMFLKIVDETENNEKLELDGETIRHLDPYSPKEEYDFKNVIREKTFKKDVIEEIKKLVFKHNT